MATPILSPLRPLAAVPADVDSLAARQARNLAQVAAVETNLRQTQWTAFGRVWSLAWGTLPANGDQSQRRNENALSPVDAWTSFGAAGAAYLQAFGVELTAAVQIDPTVGQHPVTGEDMTTIPAGYTVTPQPDGSVAVIYTAPTAAPAASAAPPAATRGAGQ